MGTPKAPVLFQKSPTKLARFILTNALITLAFASAEAPNMNAAAANFAKAATKEARSSFQQNASHRAALNFDASRQFYSQITRGALLQVLPSADHSCPKATCQAKLRSLKPIHVGDPPARAMRQNA